MPNVRVVAIITAKPNSATIVRKALQAMVAPARTEPGCVTYDLYQSGTLPNTFVTVETWLDGEALESHGSTAHVAHVTHEVDGHLAATPVVHVLASL